MFKLFTDGGARGNPGPAGIGVVIQDEKGNIIAEISEYIGHATNNHAEYTALIKGLNHALALGYDEIQCFSDSELLIKQINGKYKVKNNNLAKLFIQVHNVRLKFKKISFSSIPREKNKLADKLVNQALDKANVI